PRRRRKKGGRIPPGELIPVTVPELRRLLARLIWHDHPEPAAVLRWSRWRRRHQARAKRCHYATREARP
ncbi:MAG: hypothetical protein ACM3ZF_08995, partial [Mycobacterium leprae]